MDKPLVREDGATEIVAAIRADAAREAADIRARAGAEVAGILAEARARADARRADAAAAVDRDVARARERAFASLAIEKRRLVLEDGERFAGAVLAAVRERAARFRSEPAYRAFLLAAAVEGAAVVGAPRITIRCAAADRAILDESFIAELKRLCAASGTEAPAEVSVADGGFDEAGIVVASADGRVLLDNTFSARLRRRMDAIYAEFFGEDR